MEFHISNNSHKSDILILNTNYKEINITKYEDGDISQILIKNLSREDLFNLKIEIEKELFKIE